MDNQSESVEKVWADGKQITIIRKNIPHWQKVRVQGLKEEIASLIRASLVEESELDPEEILDGVH